jgi:hypothetical protein
MPERPYKFTPRVYNAMRTANVTGVTPNRVQRRRAAAVAKAAARKAARALK